MISVIIPAFNEEKFISRCLDSFVKQNTSYKFELIVVDNNSNDKTSYIAKKYVNKLDLTVIKENKVGVCFARNAGAKAAKGFLIVFIDADNIVPINFIDIVYKKAFKDHYKAGTIFTLPIEKSIKGYFVFLILEVIKITLKRPFGKNFCTKDIFNATKGYNEKITIGTNVDYLIRVKKYLDNNNEKMCHIHNPIYTSLRRFEREGYIKVLYKWLLGYMGFRTINYK